MQGYRAENAEPWGKAEAIGSVPLEDAAVASVHLEISQVDDGERDHCAVMAGHFHLLRDKPVEARIDNVRIEDALRVRLLVAIVVVERGRRRPGGHGDDAPVRAPIGTSNGDR